MAELSTNRRMCLFVVVVVVVVVVYIFLAVLFCLLLSLRRRCFKILSFLLISSQDYQFISCSFSCSKCMFLYHG